MTWGSRSLICGTGKKLFSCSKFTFSGKHSNLRRWGVWICSRDSLEAESLRDALCPSPIWCFPLPVTHLPTGWKQIWAPQIVSPCQMPRSLSVSWHGLLTKCLEETPGSTVHTACVALPTPSSYKASRPATSRDQQPPQGFISASSSSKVPTARLFHEQPPQCLQNTSRQVPGGRHWASFTKTKGTVSIH